MLHALLPVHCVDIDHGLNSAHTQTDRPSTIWSSLPRHIQGAHAQRMSVRIIVVTEASLPVLCDLGPGSTFQKRSVSSPASAQQHSQAAPET